MAERLRQLVRDSRVAEEWCLPGGVLRWETERIGTVHTAQGREAEGVIFVLGASAPIQEGARNWAGGRPNLLNVAVTRAKEVLYVVGNRHLWREAGVFRILEAQLSAFEEVSKRRELERLRAKRAAENEKAG
ncbi:MAG TPA: AAA domain-containing protein [Gemmata sp.]|nr:AAA domain-containing protein [Gemmata sp.]